MYVGVGSLHAHAKCDLEARIVNRQPRGAELLKSQHSPHDTRRSSKTRGCRSKSLSSSAGFQLELRTSTNPLNVPSLRATTMVHARHARSAENCDTAPRSDTFSSKQQRESDFPRQYITFRIPALWPSGTLADPFEGLRQTTSKSLLATATQSPWHCGWRW